MSEGAIQFGRVPRDLIVSGALAASGADRVELLVLLGIAVHAGAGFSGYPPMTDLAAAAGVTTRSVQRAVKRLERRGIITVDRTTGGRHRANTYTIKNPDALNVRVLPEKPRRLERQGNGLKTLTPAHQNPDGGATNTLTPCASSQQRNRGTEAQGALPGITLPPADGDESSAAIAFTFQTTTSPWTMTVGQRDKLRDEFWNLHVDTELASLAAWTEANSTKRKAPAAMHGWLRACLTRKQAERPLPGPASYPGWFHASLPTDPTAAELDAMLAGAEGEDDHAHD